jgi:hypothetical protein
VSGLFDSGVVPHFPRAGSQQRVLTPLISPISVLEVKHDRQGGRSWTRLDQREAPDECRSTLKAIAVTAERSTSLSQQVHNPATTDVRPLLTAVAEDFSVMAPSFFKNGG